MNFRFCFILMIGMLLLSGCGFQPLFATPTPTAPPPTPTLTRTPRPTATPTLTPSPTPVFATYPWKQVWFEYSVSSPPEVADQFGLTEEPLLVIYTDGQIIASRSGDSKVQTRYLSTKDVCRIVERLEFLGFYTLEDSNATDETNPLYNFGDAFQQVDEGRFYYLTLNRTSPKSLVFFEPYKKFLVRPLRKITEYLEAYNPGGFKAYVPDRLILFVKQGRDPAVSERIKARVWENSSLELGELAKVPYTFLEGNQAAESYSAIVKNESGIFIENEIEYTVTVRLLYPHEIVNVGSVPVATPTEARLPVNCKP